MSLADPSPTNSQEPHMETEVIKRKMYNVYSIQACFQFLSLCETDIPYVCSILPKWISLPPNKNMAAKQLGKLLL